MTSGLTQAEYCKVESGKIFEEYTYIDGMLNGAATEYYESGTISLERQFKNDLIQGGVAAEVQRNMMKRKTL